MVPREIKITGMNCFLSCRNHPLAFPRQAACYSTKQFVESTAADDGQSGSNGDSRNQFRIVIRHNCANGLFPRGYADIPKPGLIKSLIVDIETEISSV
jgi:hypothetical protein